MKKLFYILPVLICLLSVGIAFESIKKTEKRITYFGEFEKEFCLNNLCVYFDGQDWVYNDNGKIIPVDNELADVYKMKLSALQIVDEVSNNTDKFKEFGFDDDPLFLTMNGKKLEIGYLKNDLTGTFVRKENGKIVYFVPNVNLDKETIRKTTYWNKKFILNLADNSVKKIIVVQDGNEKEYIPENKEFLNDKLTGNLLRLKMVNFWDNIRPENTVKITLFKIELDDKNIELSAGMTKENKYWVATNEKFYYEISKESYEMLTEMTK